jgi:hypothetical protein
MLGSAPTPGFTALAMVPPQEMSVTRARPLTGDTASMRSR